MFKSRASIYYIETGYVDFTVPNTTLKNALVSAFKWTIKSPIIITQYNAAGEEIIRSTSVIPAKISIVITLDAYRKEKLLQIPPKLGFKQPETNDISTRIVLTTLQEPSPPIQGNFSISYNGELLDPIPGN